MHYISYSEDYSAHHGILGMKWGVRRYQNKDGSLTSAGRVHYGYGEKTASSGPQISDARRARIEKKISKQSDKRIKRIQKKGYDSDRISKNLESEQRKIMDDELSKTDEYKKMVKAIDKDPHQRSKDTQKAVEIYEDKISDVYAKYENELLSARLKDLGLPDTDEYRQVLKDTRKKLFDTKYMENRSKYWYLQALGR